MCVVHKSHGKLDLLVRKCFYKNPLGILNRLLGRTFEIQKLKRKKKYLNYLSDAIKGMKLQYKTRYI